MLYISPKLYSITMVDAGVTVRDVACGVSQPYLLLQLLKLGI